LGGSLNNSLAGLGGDTVGNFSAVFSKIRREKMRKIFKGRK
jgi:hypothetical protein